MPPNPENKKDKTKIKVQSGEAKAWAHCQNLGSLSAYQTFLKEFPNGRFSAQAKIKLQELQAIESAKLEQRIQQTSIYLSDGPEMALKMTSCISYRKLIVKCAKHWMVKMEAYLCP